MIRIQLENRDVDVDIVHKQIKHTYIRVSGINRLLVSTGLKTSREAVEKLLRKNRARIIRMLTSIEDRPVTAYELTSLFGVQYPLEHVNSKKHQAVLANKKIVIYGNRLDLKLKALESFYKEQVTRVALKMLEDIRPLISKDIDTGGVMIKSQRLKTMLGNCNRQKKIIKLNSLLGRFDKKYLRAILIHELVHLNISGHQADFYRMLLKYDPGYRQTRREIIGLMQNYPY